MMGVIAVLWMNSVKRPRLGLRIVCLKTSITLYPGVTHSIDTTDWLRFIRNQNILSTFLMR